MMKLPFLSPTLIVLSAALLSAQSPPAAPPAAEPAPMFRAWIFPGKSTDAVALNLRANPEDPPRALASTVDAARVSGLAYVAAQPGNPLLELKSGERVLASETPALQPGRHYTIVASFTGGKWELKTYTDGPVPRGTGERPLRVLNYAQGRETMLALGTNAPVKIVGDTVQEFRLPARAIGLTAKVLPEEGGHPSQKSMEIDLTDSPSGYLAIGPDYMGRMVPEFIAGGVSTAKAVHSYIDEPQPPAQKAN